MEVLELLVVSSEARDANHWTEIDSNPFSIAPLLKV